MDIINIIDAVVIGLLFIGYASKCIENKGLKKELERTKDALKAKSFKGE